MGITSSTILAIAFEKPEVDLVNPIHPVGKLEHLPQLTVAVFVFLAGTTGAGGVAGNAAPGGGIDRRSS